MIAAVKLGLLAEDIEAVVRRDRELGKRMKIPPTIPFDRAQWFITAVWALSLRRGQNARPGDGVIGRKRASQNRPS